MRPLDQYEASCKVRRTPARTISTYRRWVEKLLRIRHHRTGRWIHPKRLPTVFSRNEEARRPIAAMPATGSHRLVVELFNGTEKRISECCQLRVCDLHFERGQIIIRGGKGNKDRASMLPRSLDERLNAQLESSSCDTSATWRTVPELLGYKIVETTMIYTHVMSRPGVGMRSPLDSYRFNQATRSRIWSEPGC